MSERSAPQSPKHSNSLTSIATVSTLLLRTFDNASGMDYNGIQVSKGWPFTGNLLDINVPEGLPSAFNRLAEANGPVVRVSLFGERNLIVSDAKITKEVLDVRGF